MCALNETGIALDTGFSLPCLIKKLMVMVRKCNTQSLEDKLNMILKKGLSVLFKLVVHFYSYL